MFRNCILLLLLAGAIVFAEDHEATSLLGKPLYRPEIAAETKAVFEQNLVKAKAVYEKNPDDVDAIIWLGRRTAYLGRYREAIEIYTGGIEKHPDDARLYRHRGHRYLTIREMDQAIADFKKAVALIEGKPDEIEPDGLPNAKNIPTSTLKTNVWYHLGLAYYLKGEFPKAEEAYRQCAKFSKNDDMAVAVTHWLYMTLRRQGKDDEASNLLKAIRKDMNIIEDFDYHALVLMYKGEREADSIWNPESETDLSGSTIGYGVGNWHYYNGRKEKALAIFQRIIDGKEWGAFGYLAAEAEFARKEKH